ncbi:MAG: LLM class flavin-dependent oxidoreductase [Dehalococcoidia bacterium]
MELWTSLPGSPRRSAGNARRAEEVGWDGMLVVDSQNLSGDPYVCLALAATMTERLGLETSVTNPGTRHAAVAASAAISIQRLSGGRMFLGIGRGDSALAHLGHAPTRLKYFEQYLANLQAYLGCEEVPFADAAIAGEIAPPIDALGLADRPSASAIRWARPSDKVPIEVAATGRRVIGIAARHADRVMFALGADPKRLAWGLETARQAAEAAGRAPSTLSFGAYVNVVVGDDLAQARDIGRTGTGLFARFSVMHGDVAGPVDEQQAEVLHNIHDRYDMNAHGQEGGSQTTALTDEFMDGYAIIGGAERCIERFQELAAMGIDKFAITGPNFTAGSPAELAAAARFVEDVMPKLRT